MRIEAGGGLVQEQQTRIGDELVPNGSSFALSSRDAFLLHVAHFGVLTAPQFEGLQETGNASFDLLRVQLRPHFTCEDKQLSWRHCLHENIILLDERAKETKLFTSQWDTIRIYWSRKLQLFKEVTWSQARTVHEQEAPSSGEKI